MHFYCKANNIFCSPLNPQPCKNLQHSLNRHFLLKKSFKKFAETEKRCNFATEIKIHNKYDTVCIFRMVVAQLKIEKVVRYVAV